jgi:hypothetical protein
VLTDGAVDHAWDQHQFGGAYHQQGQLQNVLSPEVGSRAQFGQLLQRAVKDGQVIQRAASDPRGGYYIDAYFDEEADPVIGLQGQTGLRLAFGSDNGLRSTFPIY